MHHDEPDYTRVFIAVFLAAIVLIGWQMRIEWPRRQHLAQYSVEHDKEQQRLQAQQAAQAPIKAVEAEENPSLTRAQRIAASPRLAIHSDKLHGSIALKGARFDDLELAHYRETIEKDSPEVTLFSPAGDEEAYFAQIGWLSQDNKTKVPDQHTLWQSDKTSLSASDTATLQWDNGEGVIFTLNISLDQDYMFRVAQRVENHSGHEISVIPYAYINRSYEDPKQSNAIIHEGPIGTMSGALEDINYKELRDKGNKVYDDAGGWLGITDKYWLAALIPQDHVKVTFSHYNKNGHNRYQADYLDGTQTVEDGKDAKYNVRFFAGAKEIRVLDRYTTGDAANPPIPLFDRSVDFGALYFLTKPMLLTLTFFYKLIGNFGLAIMLLTICVRAALYPLANKSFHATAQMRALQPEMLKIRERYADDQISLNKEMLTLYKREKVNPASGCLPVLIQMPVFFALYKVLYVSIEMRHAPFFGWLRDLSAGDPSNIFTAFGLIPWMPPEWLHLGILPILMCCTMIIQMKQQPKPADPVQAKMMNFMPYFFLYIFARMPAGLVLYWTWGNLISIAQQRIITARHKVTTAKKAAKAAA